VSRFTPSSADDHQLAWIGEWDNQKRLVVLMRLQLGKASMLDSTEVCSTGLLRNESQEMKVTNQKHHSIPISSFCYTLNFKEQEYASLKVE
jgi:hypothetical protein